jgi:DNA-binding transcriptional MocR family regulator
MIESAALLQPKIVLLFSRQGGRGVNPSERIYLASTSDGELAGRLAAEKLARLMEDDLAALGLVPGSALGSLRELSERYRQGRSVVREAVSLLERRGLGRMRPGPCGGFIVAKPTPAAIGAELANHLRDAGATTQALEDACEALALMRRWHTDETLPVVSLLGICLDCLAADGGSEGAQAAATDGAAAQGHTGSLPAAIARRLATEIARTGRAGARRTSTATATRTCC